jgi:hypothetical protein
MDVMVYNKIANPELKQGIAETLLPIANTSFSTTDIILINNKIPEEVATLLQGFLHKKELDTDDVIYIIYTKSTGFGMWPLKREGRKRITKITAPPFL